MVRKLQLWLLIFIVIFSVVLGTRSYAYPPKDFQILMTPFWQREYPGEVLGCRHNDTACLTQRSDKTISGYGCALTSMAMLYRGWGFWWIPDSNHYPMPPYIDPRFWIKLDPPTLNQYLSKKDVFGRLFGFDDNDYGLHFLKTTSNFYYYDDSPGAYGLHYKYLVPNYDCTPVSIGQLRRNGTVRALTKSASCFMTDWSEGAMSRLDYDLDWGTGWRPAIMKISYTDLRPTLTTPDEDTDVERPRPVSHPSHFVVIAGYEKIPGRTDHDGWYRAHNPSFYDNQADNIPKALNGETQYGRRDNRDRNEFRFDRIVSVYRFINKPSPTPLDTSRLDLGIRSPIEVQILDPDGNLIGYDPESGKKFLENPMSLYYEDIPVTALYGADTPSEPVKRLTIIQPRQGNYIFKLFGTGDGPYTIDMEFTKSDGTPNLVTTLTGTATPSLSETYRITYSPTGEASLSQTNQAPVANAGSNQTGEQSYEITLDGSGSSDPDGDPLNYTWSFISRPPNSATALSNSDTAKPIFTPDLPGTYVLQLVVNDYFTDSEASTVTVTATPVKSRISVVPNFLSSINEGTGFISFDINNIGRIGVSSGTIKLTLTDPDGQVVSTGSQSFNSAVGETKTVSVPVTIPSLKFGNYTLTYTQSDETRTGSQTTSTIPNSVLTSFSFDKITYRVRETSNLTLNITNTGKFNLRNISVTVSVPDAGYTNTKTVFLTPNNTAENFAFTLPSSMTAGQHIVNVTFGLPSGSTNIQSVKFSVPASALTIGYSGEPRVTVGEIIRLTLENTGGVDTAYTSEKLVLKDARGMEIDLGPVSGAIKAGESKAIDLKIPSQAAAGYVMFSAVLKDAGAGRQLSFDKAISIVGLEAALSVRTDKDVYLSTAPVTALESVTTADFNIADGLLDIKVTRQKEAVAEKFVHFLPKSGWAIFLYPMGVAVAPDGAFYVADTSYDRIQKFSEDGRLLTKWGSYGTGGGQFDTPIGIAVGPDGSLFVTDTWNHRIQKFDSNGNFISTWGSFGSEDGQFYSPQGIAVGSDETVYVADSENRRIQKFDINGNFIGKWVTRDGEMGLPFSPSWLTVFEGYVYVTDPWNRRILKFDGNGNFILKWGRYGSANGQFLFPTGISVSSDGYVFVADDTARRIQKFDSNGNFVSKWGSLGSNDSQFEAPNGIAVSTNGHVYVADTRNNRIQKFDTDGNFIGKWARYGSGPGQFFYPYGISSGLDGSVYVADTLNYRIQKFDNTGNLTAVWGGYGDGTGKFYSPVDVAAGANGAVYVVDSMNDSIQQFDTAGNFIAQWGNYGGGPGQFDTPSAAAVAPDGSVFVADTNNDRIQKFDPNGNFVLQWGSFCNTDSNWDMKPDKPCNGQFFSPQGVAVGNDGSIYVSDTNNHRLQKFDGNGNYLAQWGRIGNGSGQFSQPQRIGAGPGGYVYVADTGNSRIQKFDGNGAFLASWGYYGKEEGQFSNPSGIAVDQEGTVYIADTSNHRIQKMTVPGAEVLFKGTYPVDQASNVIKDHVTNIGALNTSGKLYLQATLKNALGQTLSRDDYPFYMVQGDTALIFDTDKKIDRTGETVTITGEVRNLAAVEATDLKVGVKWKAGATEAIIYTEMFSLPAGGSHPFTATIAADSEGVVLLTGTVSQNNTKLVEITDQYEAAGPKVIVAAIAPEVVGSEPFTMNVELKNEGKVEATTRVQITDDRGQSLGNQEIAIPAGETRLVQYNSQIASTTNYTFAFTGDLNQTITKTVAYGLGAGIQFGVQSPGLVYPEGKTTIPVTITNTGLLDETLSVSYMLSGGATREEIRSYFIPKGGSVADALNYDLNSGSYQISASSSRPVASTQAAFSVVKENMVLMTTNPGTQGTNGLIPVTVNLTNSGYNDINGTLALAVMNNDGKAVWRGEALVSGLKPGTSGNYEIKVDSTGIISGAYAANLTLYSSSGLQLASDETQVRVLGPIFEVTSLPANPAFTVGRQAVLNFSVRNTGTATGTATFSTKAMDILNQSSELSLDAGEERALGFNFTVPEDAEGKDYLADYSLTPVVSQATKGQAVFRVNEVKVDVAASLDKEAYRNGETAILSLNISKLSQTEDSTYIAIIRYGAHHDMQTFTLSSQPAILAFNVPLQSVTGKRLFYGIHFESGNAIYRSSVPLNEALADLAADFRGEMTEGRVLKPQVARDSTVQISTAVTNYGKTASAATSLSIYEVDPSTSSGQVLIETKPVRPLNPNESAETSTAWNALGKAGSRTLRVTVDPDDAVPEYSEANNTGQITIRVPDVTAFTDTDKETYKIRQKVYITSTLTNLTSSTTYTNLLLLTTARDSSGQEVYNKSLSLGPVPAMNTTTSIQAWSTARLSLDGIYTILQRVFAGSEQMAESTKQVTLEKAPDFSISTDADSRKIRQGELATFNALVEPFNGWDHEVSLSMEGLPSGVSAQFNPDRIVPPAEVQAAVATNELTPAGTHTLYLSGQGTDEGEIVVRTVPPTLDVSAFSLETSSGNQSIKQLETAVFPVNVSSLNGYEGTVSLSLAALPRGMKASLDTTTVQAPGIVNLSIRTSKYAKPGTYTLTITGNDGLVSHSLDLGLVLTPNPDIAAGIVTAAGPGPRNDALVRTFSPNGQLIKEFTAFNSKYGATAIAADIDGDGYDEIIVAQGPGPNNTATLRAFRRDGSLISEYTPFDSKYGLTLASADLDGDWMDELIVGTGPDPKNAGVLKVIKYTSAGFVQSVSQTANSRNSYGLNVAAGDIDGDGLPEIVTAAGPGPNNEATVSVWKYGTGLTLLSTFAASDGLYGLNISSGDIDGDGKVEIITGAGPDPKNASLVRVYKADGTLIREIIAFNTSHAYGVNVSAGDLDGDGAAEIITGAGPGPQNEATIKVFKADGSEIKTFAAYPEDFKYGVKVSAGNTGGCPVQ